ncbi:hypothetical protein GCM10028799_20790 [Kribbella italica]
MKVPVREAAAKTFTVPEIAALLLAPADGDDADGEEPAGVSSPQAARPSATPALSETARARRVKLVRRNI